MSTLWTCQRILNGNKCGFRNPGRKRKCLNCGKPKPARRKPAHTIALDLPYEHFVAVNGGDFCGICGREPSPTRRLDRDHDHRSGRPRGLLCHRCNRALAVWMTSPWLRGALDYLERAA